MKKVMLVAVIALAVIFYLWGQPAKAQASDTTVAIVAMDNGDVYIVKYKPTNPTSMAGYAFNDPNNWTGVKLMNQRPVIAYDDGLTQSVQASLYDANRKIDELEENLDIRIRQIDKINAKMARLKKKHHKAKARLAGLEWDAARYLVKKPSPDMETIERLMNENATLKREMEEMRVALTTKSPSLPTTRKEPE